MLFCFFFKQKTAYEMRISDWSSDVCSSDLKSYVYIQNANGQYGYYILKGLPVTYCVGLLPPEVKQRGDLGQYDGDMVDQGPSMDGTYSPVSPIGRASCRDRGCQYV